MQDKYKQPKLAVDAIIEIADKIVLIRRKNPPYGWALPGGFVEYGETLEQAVRREAMEETGLELLDLRQFHAYSEPDRDPRFHVVSVVFIAKGKGTPRAADDAAGIALFSKDELPEDITFDHKKILEDYFKFKETGEIPR